jgi:hypothetical protein
MEQLKIDQVEPRFANELETPLKTALKKLGYSIPESFRLRVNLLQANGRKKRSNAGAYTWAPESEPMQFWLEPFDAAETVSTPSDLVAQEPEAPPASKVKAPQALEGVNNTNVYVHPAEAELLRVLDRAESTPGWNFVSLKKFRDEILPSANVPSIRSDVERQSVIGSAIEKRFILTGKVQNPKSSQFPVTSIRINRLMPAVQEVLGIPKRNLEFHPIHVKGEPLSSIILRERR